MQDLIGYLAAFLTTFAFVPQAYKVYRTNQTKDLSLSLFVIFSMGVFMWLIYSIMLDSIPMKMANTITLILSLYILYKIYKNENKENSI